MISDNTPLLPMFLVSARMGSPFSQEQNAAIQTACPKCKNGLQLKMAGGASIILSRQELREHFEKIGTVLSMSQNVAAGGAFKELGDEVCTWCDESEVGDVADIVNISTTITRLSDGFMLDSIKRLGMPNPAAIAPRLMLAGEG